MKRRIITSIAILIVFINCKDAKRDYIEKVFPILSNLEQIGLEMEKTVEAVQSGGISILEFEAKISDIDKRLSSEKDNFNKYMAPMGLEQFHKNILEAISAEQLAISSVRSYATRKNMYLLADKKLEELGREEAELLSRQSDDKARTRLSKISTERANLAKQKESLRSEMDAQMKFYSNSHEYFVKMLKSMKEGAQRRIK
ncbi:MAG: hypothetical protein N2746_00630 [Deltaproteobacteria bacterium]|nr:hypothetical protein [Deltaproteobacteria bacterium]